MIEDLLSHQATIRLGGFAGIFAAMALWELLAPRRKQAIPPQQPMAEQSRHCRA